MNILFLGDIVGSPGRRAVEEMLDRVVDRHFIDLVVGNGENASGGIGITPPVADQLLNMGIDLLTSGNHIWKHRDILPCRRNGNGHGQHEKMANDNVHGIDV